VILIPIMSCMRWSTCTWQLWAKARVTETSSIFKGEYGPKAQEWWFKQGEGKVKAHTWSNSVKFSKRNLSMSLSSVLFGSFAR
jgi:hypothetical protein